MVRHHPANIMRNGGDPGPNPGRCNPTMYFDVKIPEKRSDWKKFEDDVADVFEQFGYKVKRDVRFKTSVRFQIDVIAYDEQRCFFIDCKDHLYIPPSGEETFILKQKVRAENYVNISPDLKYKKKIILLITRNKTSSLINHVEAGGKIFGVDINALRDLLTNIQIYLDELYYFI